MAVNNEQIQIWPQNYKKHASPDGFIPTLEPYLLESSKKLGAVLVLPGGGYQNRAPHEGHDIATAFNKAGLNAFVLNYRVAPARFPDHLFDVCKALEVIRNNSDSWNVNIDQIAVCGFSAGGHLAASTGTLFHKYTENFPEVKQNVRPDALILCYPVITAYEYAHRGSFENLLGENPAPEILESVSLEKQVSKTNPPTFLWHTAQDTAVPFQNSLLFAQSLQKHSIPVEMHIYQDGQHGIGLGHDFPRAKQWITQCTDWLKYLGWQSM